MRLFPFTFMKIFNKTEPAVSKDSIFPDYSALWRSGISDNLNTETPQKEDQNCVSRPIIA